MKMSSIFHVFITWHYIRTVLSLPCKSCSVIVAVFLRAQLNIPIVVCVNNWNIAPSIISKSIDPEVGHVHISLKSKDNINEPFQYLLRKLVDKNCKINT